jgi:nucleoside-diphosphate-sugar epimerase
MAQAGDGYRGRAVLITGASGFLGGALAFRLAEAGAVVHGLSRHGHGNDGPIRWWTADPYEDVLRATEPEVVFHLAGETSASRSLALVQPTFAANVAATVNLLAAVAEASPETRIVLAGSLEEPDVGSGEPPASPYALSKVTAAAYGSLVHRLYGVPVVHLRVFMAYGPAQRAVEKLVPHVTLSLLRDRPVELTSGSREIDWIYVDDVVGAFAAAGLADDAIGQTLDVGSGTTASVQTVAEEIARLTGGELRFGALPDRPHEREPVADPGPAERALGWRATTPLREGLRATVEWYRAALARGDIRLPD